MAAEGAVNLAVDLGRRPGIAVDDDICLEAMLQRVIALLDERPVKYTVETSSGVRKISVSGAGVITIVAADQLVGKPGN